MTDPGPTPPKRSKPSSDETGNNFCYDFVCQFVTFVTTHCKIKFLEERSKEESPVSSRIPLRRQLSRKYSYNHLSI